MRLYENTKLNEADTTIDNINTLTGLLDTAGVSYTQNSNAQNIDITINGANNITASLKGEKNGNTMTVTFNNGGLAVALGLRFGQFSVDTDNGVKFATEDASVTMPLQ